MNIGSRSRHNSRLRSRSHHHNHILDHHSWCSYRHRICYYHCQTIGLGDYQYWGCNRCHHTVQTVDARQIGR